MATGRDELAAVTCGGYIYAMGGSHLVWPVRHVLDSAERFDPRSGTWQELPRLTRERCAAAAVALHRRLVVLGGCDEDGVALSSTESLDLTLGQPRWEVLPSMRRARCNFAAATSAGRILVAGGYDDHTRDVDTVEQFDPSHGAGWEAVHVLPVPRWGVRAASRAGHIFIVGGHVGDGEVGTTDCLEHSGAWVNYAELHGSRRSFGLAEAQHVCRAWRKAFAEFGFCQATGHGIQDEVIEEAYAVARQFFTLPVEAKQRCDTGKAYGASSGYTGPGAERVSATATELPDGKVLGSEKARPPDRVESMIFYGREEDVVPEEVKNYREVMKRYYEELRGLLLASMALTAASLELPLNYFDRYFTADKLTKNEISLRLAYYPAYEDGVEPLPGQLRYGEHTDYTGFTLLWQDHNITGPQTAKEGLNPPLGGLQVRMPDGSWADCPPAPGAFTINAGDLIQAWTNDEFMSNWHRVTNPPPGDRHDRISLVVFTGPANDTIVEPLPTCVSPDRPPKCPMVDRWSPVAWSTPDMPYRYMPISAGEHLAKKLQASNV
ncbi:2-oxoglutarate-dependent dioxygenase (Ascochitine biosynthesis cluster protein 3) [Durusdinium trenchii]|uniref:2-oxoglutarate-dependent dioxygenase (Ascochitine biosynthesis cluster protein 3) n=1 Tax=Durusdinium trenchii TaxID=1381693 RepID=A0ABP0IU45_9DINO